MNQLTALAREYRAEGRFTEFADLCKNHTINEETQDQFWNNMLDQLCEQADVVPEAIAKLNTELKNFTGESKEKEVSASVAKTLQYFCKNEVFATAVVGSKKTLSDCCKEIMKGVGRSIPDIEAYRRAVKFYFPKATVRFEMEIEINGTVAMANEKPNRKPAKQSPQVKTAETIQISLF